MSTEFRTVLISADCTARFEFALESGVELAHVLQLGLAGLFVEEEALIDFSSLPFSRVIQGGRTGARALDPEAMRRAIEREGRRLRAELARRAEQFNLRWRFDVVRGRHVEAIEHAEGDIVVLPLPSGQGSLAARIEIARALVARGRAALLTPEQKPPRGPVTLLARGSAHPGDIELAARIAERLEARLVVDFWPENAGDEREIARRIAEIGKTRAEIELVLRGAAPSFEQPARNARLILGRWSLIERLGLLHPRSAVIRSGARILLLPDGAA